MNDGTREKILKTSHKLFADKGYNGVSVREIASACEVNVASINYHFNNKASLYQQTVIESLHKTEKRIAAIYHGLKNPDIETLSLSVYDDFLNNAEDLRASFRLLLTNDVHMEEFGNEVAKHKGPPGSEFFSQCLLNIYPKAGEENISWAVRTIFTQIIHKAIIMCNSSICQSMKKVGIDRATIKNDIKRLVNVVQNDLK